MYIDCFPRPLQKPRRLWVPNAQPWYGDDGSLNMLFGGYNFTAVNKLGSFLTTNQWVRGNCQNAGVGEGIVANSPTRQTPMTVNNPSGSPSVRAVISGLNQINLSWPIPSDKFVALRFFGTHYTPSFYIELIKLIFEGGIEKYLHEAVNEGYIQPMVNISSYVQDNDSYQFQQPLNVYHGGRTDTKSYANLYICFVNIVPIIGYKFTTNKAWDTTYADGTLIRYCDKADGIMMKQNYQNNILTLVKADGEMNDTNIICSRGRSLTNYNTLIKTDIKKFGTGSMYFNGINSGIRLQDSVDWALGTGDFSLDFYVYPIDGGHGSAWSRLMEIGTYPNAGGFNLTMYNLENPARVSFQASTGSQLINSSAIPNNIWSHVALTRFSGVFKLYIDGILNGSYSTAVNIIDQTLSIGSKRDNTAEFFKGYIDNFRLMKF